MTLSAVRATFARHARLPIPKRRQPAVPSAARIGETLNQGVNVHQRLEPDDFFAACGAERDEFMEGVIEVFLGGSIFVLVLTLQRRQADLLGGVVTLEGIGYQPDRSAWQENGLYRTWTLNKENRQSERKVKLTAIPYYAWGNRGLKSMRVWIPYTQRP